MKTHKAITMTLTEAENILQDVLDNRTASLELEHWENYYCCYTSEQCLDGGQVDQRLSDYFDKKCTHYAGDEGEIIILFEEEK